MEVRNLKDSKCVSKGKKYHIRVTVEKKTVQSLIYFNKDGRSHGFKKNSTNQSRFS